MPETEARRREPGGTPRILEEWLDRPQRRPLRRALFQVHLWLALLLGAYVIVISVSGSAVVFRGDLGRWLIPRTVPSAEGTRLTGEALGAALDRVYADDVVLRFSEARRPNGTVAVLLERNGKEHERLFDPYAVSDMGAGYPWQIAVMEWMVSLHDDLLGGYYGRKVNGAAGALVLLLVLSGAVIWWPGRARWKQGLYATPSMPRALWHLHSAMGFWIFLLLLLWALTGVYMAFPQPVESLIDWFDDDLTDFDRPGEPIVRFLVTGHFGRFGGLEIRIAYVVLGLLPAVLFVTGFILWWRRVVRPRWRRMNGGS